MRTPSGERVEERARREGKRFFIAQPAVLCVLGRWRAAVFFEKANMLLGRWFCIGEVLPGASRYSVDLADFARIVNWPYVGLL